MVSTRIPNLKQTAPMRAATQTSRTAGCSANLEWSPHAWAVDPLKWPFKSGENLGKIWESSGFSGYSWVPYFQTSPIRCLGICGLWLIWPTKKGLVKVANVQGAFRLLPEALYKESQILSEQNKPGIWAHAKGWTMLKIGTISFPGVS